MTSGPVKKILTYEGTRGAKKPRASPAGMYTGESRIAAIEAMRIVFSFLFFCVRRKMAHGSGNAARAAKIKAKGKGMRRTTAARRPASPQSPAKSPAVSVVSDVGLFAVLSVVCCFMIRPFKRTLMIGGSAFMPMVGESRAAVYNFGMLFLPLSC